MSWIQAKRRPLTILFLFFTSHSGYSHSLPPFPQHPPGLPSPEALAESPGLLKARSGPTRLTRIIHQVLEIPATSLANPFSSYVSLSGPAGIWIPYVTREYPTNGPANRQTVLVLYAPVAHQIELTDIQSCQSVRLGDHTTIAL